MSRYCTTPIIIGDADVKFARLRFCKL
jgi:hypothetical protein